MKKHKASLDEQKREFFRRMGRNGGKIGGSKGGKAAAARMTAAARIARAYFAGKQGGRPRQLDHAKIVKLCESGKPPAEVAGLVGCGIATVYRVLRERID
jgi:DNA invertase Pin-like site-specific DNA recombinase